MCDRGSDWAPAGWLLHLISGEGVLIAVDVPPDTGTTVSEVMVHGIAIFRSVSNVLDEAWREWETNYGARQGAQGLASYWFKLQNRASSGSVSNRCEQP